MKGSTEDAITKTSEKINIAVVTKRFLNNFFDTLILNNDAIHIKVTIKNFKLKYCTAIGRKSSFTSSKVNIEEIISIVS